MLTAIRKSDSSRVIGYEIEKNKNESYTCDFCNCLVIHHKSDSQARIGHFKHKFDSNCFNNRPESEKHIRTKVDIRDHLKDYKSIKLIELEKWICNMSIRPDIYIETSKTKIAIEVQASTLSPDQIINRTKRYFKHNIHVLWVLVWDNSRTSKSDYVINDCRFNCFDSDCDHSIKLNEMELFISSMNFGKLIFWDYLHSNGPGFYVVDLDKYVGESSEYYSADGEYQYHEGRVAKNKKIITDIQFDFLFEGFEPKTIQEFKIPYKSYSIPRRTQMSIPKKK